MIKFLGIVFGLAFLWMTIGFTYSMLRGILQVIASDNGGWKKFYSCVLRALFTAAAIGCAVYFIEGFRTAIIAGATIGVLAIVLPPIYELANHRPKVDRDEEETAPHEDGKRVYTNDDK